MASFKVSTHFTNSDDPYVIKLDTLSEVIEELRDSVQHHDSATKVVIKIKR